MRLSKRKSTILAAVLILLTGTCTAGAMAQSGDNSWNRIVPVKRKPKPVGQKIIKRTIRRRPTIAKRLPRTTPTVERVPLLTLQWRILKFRQDGSQEEANPGLTFTPDDRMRIAVKANQDGYLYIIRQSAPDQDGELIFPDKRINDGKNFVAKNQEIFFPSDCRNIDYPCWYIPQGTSGADLYTLILSRDEVEELPNTAEEGSAVTLKPDEIVALKKASAQQITRGQGLFNSRYSIWIRNNNTEDNEEIIETVYVNRGEKGAAPATGSTDAATQSAAP